MFLDSGFKLFCFIFRFFTAMNADTEIFSEGKFILLL